MTAQLIESSDSHARRSLKERVRHSLEWRLAGLRSRFRDHAPEFIPVLRELHAVTGKSYATIARDLVSTRRAHGLSALEYVSLLLWEVPESRRGDYLVSRSIDPFLESLLDPGDHALGFDKVAFADHDRAHGVPWLPTLAVVNRRQGPPAEGAAVVARAEDLWPLLEQLARASELVLKPAYGLQGRGFFAVSRDGSAVDSDGTRVDRDLLTRRVFRYGRRRTGYGYLVQRMLKSHPAIVELTGVDALATLRIVTAKMPSGRPRLLQSFLKIPAPGRLTDNFRRGVSGTFIAGVDPASGRVGDLVGLVRPRHRLAIERTRTHPQTGKTLGGSSLPRWDECLDVVTRASDAHPRSPIFGWDVGLTTDGWVLLDGNPTWGPIGGQVCAGEGLRPTLARLYPEHWR